MKMDITRCTNCQGLVFDIFELVICGGSKMYRKVGTLSDCKCGDGRFPEPIEYDIDYGVFIGLSEKAFGGTG